MKSCYTHVSLYLHHGTVDRTLRSSPGVHVLVAERKSTAFSDQLWGGRIVISPFLQADLAISIMVVRPKAFVLLRKQSGSFLQYSSLSIRISARENAL